MPKVQCARWKTTYTCCLDIAVVLQFAVQIAVCFGKVARQDFPKTWPSLFEDVTGHMQSGGALASRRVYLVLHHVLKELATKRLATDKKHFAQVPSHLHRSRTRPVSF